MLNASLIYYAKYKIKFELFEALQPCLQGAMAIDLNASGKPAPKKKPEKLTFSAGDIVWAKVSGFKFWAARVRLVVHQ